MELEDFFALIHPTIAVIVVFPLIGIVVNRAWLVRQRRQQIRDGQKSKIPPIVGSEHVAIGNWLSGSVVGVALLGLAYPIFSKMIKKDVFSQDPLRVILVAAIFGLAIASFVFLLRAGDRKWRGIFAGLSSVGLIVLGLQPEVYRLDSAWYMSHYYYGTAAALLMIFSVAIVQDIYQDKSNRWRTVHIILNCLALLLFLGQGFTGTRDLLDISPSWQSKHINQCDFKNRICPKAATK